MRHTKIIATLGPSSSSHDAVDELVAAGVDVFRLNFSHGSHDTHAELYRRVRLAAERAGRVVAILQDLSGPKIRTGPLAAAIELRRGEPLRIGIGDREGGPGRIFTTYADLPRAVHAGDDLLLDDGRIGLKVVETDGREILATVVDGGMLGERTGINAPGVTLPAAPLTGKDRVDLTFGLELGVDIVALSFVRNAGDLRRARELMRSAGHGEVPLVAKLERPEAMDHLDEILRSCDAVMVARGDLGLEMPLAAVPRVQKEITLHARTLGIPVIVATQVLDSMRTQPRPTRAEVSDAANAVDDGVDAIMLAGETAVGAFPTRSVQTLDAVIREAETIPSSRGAQGMSLADHVALGHERALCESAVTLARLSRAQAIIAVTRTGRTPRLLAGLRPEATVYAATDEVRLARRLTLLWGVVPLVTPPDGDVMRAYGRFARRLDEDEQETSTGTVVLVSVSSDLDDPQANFVRLVRLTA